MPPSKRTWALEGNDEPHHAPRTAGLHLSRGIVRSDGRDGRNRLARRAESSSLRGLCRLCVVAYALVLVESFVPMDSAQTVVHRAVPLLFFVPNLFIWISMRPSGVSMRGTRRRNDADGSADSISCEPMNKENK